MKLSNPKAIFGLGMIAGIVTGVAVSFFGNSTNASQPYASQQSRIISSLSAKDISDLQAGKGWGLAKPAEFNNYPGPAHVLEFADKLDLSDEQKAAIETSFDSMQMQAKRYGLALIDAEAELDNAFKNGVVTGDVLKQRLSVAEAARAALRNVHLSAHLEITPLLNTEQKTKYAELRGYGSGHSGHSGH